MTAEELQEMKSVKLKDLKKQNIDVDFDALYEKADEELALQQNKRDQLVSTYLTMFTFLLPFALSLGDIDWRAKGFILLAVAIVGFLFSLIVIRYRYYKEIYWMCCRAITMLMNIQPEKLNHVVVKAVYAQIMEREGGRLVEKKGGKRRFKPGECMRRNLFSAETIYFVVLALITSVLTGVSAGLISGFDLWPALMTGAVAALAVMTFLMWLYFRKLKEVYAPLVSDDPDVFDKVFRKAWFLDLDVDM